MERFYFVFTDKINGLNNQTLKSGFARDEQERGLTVVEINHREVKNVCCMGQGDIESLRDVLKLMLVRERSQPIKSWLFQDFSANNLWQ